MKTPEQLKGAVRNMAASKNIQPQAVLQMFFFERILERLAASRFNGNFILKGGLLISSMIGITERTTLDMDTTVRGLPMDEEQISNIIQEILPLDVDDNIQFHFKRIEPIREDDTYNNFRVHVEAQYGKINNPMKIDITTGDEITPAAIRYDYPSLFEQKNISIMAYTLETILAEKYETILRRNISTTRARDFYDLHILFHQRYEDLRPNILKQAVHHTAYKRGSTAELKEWADILSDMRDEPALYTLWSNYTKENIYASNLSWPEVMATVESISRLLEE